MAAVSGLARTGETLIARSSPCARHRGTAVWRRMCGLDRRGSHGLRRVPRGRRLVHGGSGSSGPAPVAVNGTRSGAAPNRVRPHRCGVRRKRHLARLAAPARQGDWRAVRARACRPEGRDRQPRHWAGTRSRAEPLERTVAICDCEPASRCHQGTCDVSGTAVGPGFGTANRDASRHGRAPADALHFPPLRAPSLDGPARRSTSAGPPAQRSIRQRIRAAAALEDALGRPAVGHPSERSKAQLPAFAPNPRVRPLRSDRRRTILPHAGAPRSGPGECRTDADRDQLARMRRHRQHFAPPRRDGHARRDQFRGAGDRCVQRGRTGPCQEL